jgi:hypothetical protein
MTRFPDLPPDLTKDDYAECAVCRTDTLRFCSPCGDPVCANCRCPNGCEDEAEEAVRLQCSVELLYVDVAA